MIELASRYGAGFVMLRDIADCQDISNGYLEQILPYLRKAGLVNSRRGAHGGYSLTRPPSKITLREIVYALEGDLTVVDCVSEAAACPKAGKCRSRGVWVEVSRKIGGVLEALTLQDIVRGKTKTKKK
jgi:Rrf2 family protein